MSVSRQKRDWGMIIAAAVAAVLLIWAIFYVIQVLHNKTLYREFISDLSRSTIYAYENKSLEMSACGEEREVDQKRAGYRIYDIILIAGLGKVQSKRKLPDTPADMEVRFGNGNILQAWEVKVKNSRRGTGLGTILCYTDKEGRQFIYDTDRFAVDFLRGDYGT